MVQLTKSGHTYRLHAPPERIFVPEGLVSRGRSYNLEDLREGMFRGSSNHGGSKDGNDTRYVEEAYENSKIAAIKTDLYRGNYGGGEVGNMGASTRGFLDGGIKNILGITLTCFDHEQGAGNSFGLPHLVMNTMLQRMALMRNGTNDVIPGLHIMNPDGTIQTDRSVSLDGTELAIMHRGGFGSLQESVEWVWSKNGIVKPNLGHAEHYEGLTQIYNAFVRNGFAPPSLLDRWMPYNDGPHLVDIINGLNSRPPKMETLDDLSPVPSGWDERTNAIIFTPRSLDGLHHFFNRIVDYDISGATGRTELMKPFVVIDEGTDIAPGLQKLIRTGLDTAFISASREQFVHFARSKTHAKQIARQLEKIDPLKLGEKHAEAGGSPAPV